MTIGTKLRGKTKKHPYIIVIIGQTPRKYRYRVIGRQHDGKSERYLNKAIIELHFQVIQKP